MKEGALFVRDKVTFGAYSRGFFNDDGRYAMNKRNSWKRLSPQHLHERRRMLDSHVNPFLRTIIFRISDTEIWKNSAI
jgi:hypothetical protein